MENIDWLAWFNIIVLPAIILVAYFARRSDFRKLIKHIDNLCKETEQSTENTDNRH